MSPRRDTWRDVAMAVAIAVIGAWALMAWSVCEQDDRYCMVMGGVR